MKYILLLSLLFFGNNPNQGIIIPNTSVLVEKQHGAFWCWAATKVAIYRYYGKKVKQGELVTKRHKLKNLTLETYYSPKYSLRFYEIDDYLKEFKHKDIRSHQEIIESLQRGHPIIFMFNYHVSIVVGYNFKENIFYLMDTRKESEHFSKVSYNFLRHNYHASFSIKGFKENL